MANDKDDPVNRRGTFKVKVSDESFTFRTVTIADSKVTGAQIAAAAGRSDPDRCVVLQRLANGEIESVRPKELISLVEPGAEEFFVIEGSDLFGFSVDGASMQWPLARITGSELRQLAKIDSDLELVLERVDSPDETVEDDATIDLSRGSQEKFNTRSPKIPLIWVNEHKHRFEKEEITYDEVVALYLGVGNTQAAEYLVKYSKGPPENIKGTLAPGAKVVIKNGMRFRVSGTGES